MLALNVSRVTRTRTKFAGAFAAGVAVALVLLAISSVMRPAHAQTISAAPAPGTPGIRTTPLVAPKDAAREIEVFGVWPNGCGQVTAAMDTSLVAATDNLVVRMTAPPINLAPGCSAFPLSYRFTFSYTPTADGVVRIAPVFDDGVRRGDGRIVTTSDAGTRSVGDITGAWFDPNSNGSGFTFVHNYMRSDRSFGTWYAYDAQGVPRWFVIDGIAWSRGGLTMTGNVSSTKAAVPCPAGATVCAVRAGVDQLVGTITIDFDGLEPMSDVGLMGRVSITSNAGVSLYSGRIIRLGL